MFIRDYVFKHMHASLTYLACTVFVLSGMYRDKAPASPPSLNPPLSCFVEIAALPFLHKTEVFLYPVVVIIMLLVLSITLWPLNVRVNVTREMAKLYFD